MASAAPAAPSVPTPAGAPSGGSPAPGGGSGRASGDAGRSAEPQFDARADAVDLFEGPDSDEQARGDELAQQALADGEQGGEGLELPDDGGADELGQDEQQDDGQDGPISIGGLNFPNAAALEQYVATNAGRLQSAMNTGRQWEAYARQLEAEREGGAAAGDAPDQMGAEAADAPPARDGELPADFVSAYHQTFTPDWVGTARQHFVQALNATDEAGVTQAFDGLINSLTGQFARFVQSREQGLAKRLEPYERQAREGQQIDQATKAHGAVIRQVAALTDPGDPTGATMMFPDLFRMSANGPQFKDAQAKATTDSIVRAMIKRGETPSVENFAYHYAALRGLALLSAPSSGAPSRPAGGDPTLSGPGGASPGAPRRQPHKSDPSGLPQGPSAGRVMGIRRR